MFYHYIRSTIIVLIKMLIPVLLLLLLTPQILHLSKPLNQAQAFFKIHQSIFLVSHFFFYLLLYLLWPKFIQVMLYRKGHEANPSQIKLAVNARWYLLSTLFFLETLFWWK